MQLRHQSRLGKQTHEMSKYSHCAIYSRVRRHYKLGPRLHYVAIRSWWLSDSWHNKSLLSWPLTNRKKKKIKMYHQVEGDHEKGQIGLNI